ncbi:ParB N-terminal domain-containing protein [Microcoleus sp. FACHB-672]|uniref:ParB N-terminal domain-containing protein n=1 Tax=Microcoleus sp. FACHB-672 TaxID=2692825 RepID=UPI00168328B0|nr:ParB N-terminal domain-containing protein [Microcoleus sp. FACHB-672]MBD2039799.1 ParB N-terminal domain-containing protein [Microcoleus sp. FACHB-672]
MSIENSQEGNSSEISNPLEEETASDEKSGELTQQPASELAQSEVEFVNPKTLLSRQKPSEMTPNKIKMLQKKIRATGFNPEYPIEVTNVDGRLIILDGHHRVAAAIKLAIDVPITRQQLSPLQEQQLLDEVAEAQQDLIF